jgi:hypothetical protein
MLLAGSLTGALASAVTTMLIWAMWRSSTDTTTQTNFFPSPYED